MKCVIRFAKTIAVVTIVVGGAAALATVVLGKDNVKDLAATVTDMAREGTASLIDQRAALERRVAELQSAYPKRVAELRSLIKEAQTQLAFIERDRATAEDVLELCREDIALLKADHDSDGSSSISSGSVNFRGRYYGEVEAQSLLVRALETEERYIERFNRLQDEAELVQQEVDALNGELNGLRQEQAEFEAEISAIRREIDRIEHNEKLIDLAERRKQQPHGNPHGEAITSLQSLRSQLDVIRMQQEEELQQLKVQPGNQDYETRARLKRLNERKDGREGPTAPTSPNTRGAY